MVNLIPLAGRGSRFSDIGISLPKPLIPVSGKPMIQKAVEDLPPCTKWVFIVLQEHVERYSIDDVIRTVCPDATIITTPEVTNGQASTCMLAESVIEDGEEVFIGATDVGIYCDYLKLKKVSMTADCVIPSITEHECLKKNPNQFGWLILEEDQITVKSVSVKKAISDRPYFDHSQTGFFYFKTFKTFKESYSLMVKEKFLVNGEYYLDSLPIFLNKLNRKTISFPIDLYPNWGTPEDLNDYLLIEHYCKFGGKNSLSKDYTNRIKLWEQYFKDKF
jgi:NDP-sugar pyrophosphorylase family protein